MPKRCKHCGKFDCKEHDFLLGKAKKIDHFAGSSPPEIFVGRWNYPNIYTGILSPQEYGNTQIMSSPELWHKNQIKIPEIIDLRTKLIYGRTQSHIKHVKPKFKQVFDEIAMTNKSAATEFTLRKPVSPQKHPDSRVPLISKAAHISRVTLQENTKIDKKVDYLVNDTDAKSALAIKELYRSKAPVSNIIKILSAGLLGLKTNRRLVPTRWSITAVDDTLSKEKLPRIKLLPTINEIHVHQAEYLGNHYEFILLPDKYSFEVIEMRTNFSQTQVFWHDHETFFPRKKYADNVTGAYYANRLALTEHLEKIKRQAQCLVLREIRPEYYAPCGVGILRETSRAAFRNKPEKFNTLKEAFERIQTRLRQPITNFTSRSYLLENYGKQKHLSEFF